jgi:hypothetical protein
MNTNTYTKTKGIPKNRWNHLWRCKRNADWRKFWEARVNAEEQLSRECQMSLFMWLQGFTEEYIIAVMAAWWEKHGIEGNFYRVRHYVIPLTYDFALPFLPQIEANHRERQRVAQAKRRAKKKAKQIAAGLTTPPTRQAIIEYAMSHTVMTAEDIMTSTGLSRSAASKQLSRLVSADILIRVGFGRYAIKPGVANE